MGVTHRGEAYGHVDESDPGQLFNANKFAIHCFSPNSECNFVLKPQRWDQRVPFFSPSVRFSYPNQLSSV